MLLDEAVGGVGAGQLAGVGAPGAAYGRPGAQRAQQPRQVAAAKGPGPAGAAPGGALRHEAGAPLQLRALGPRLGSALGKISESAEWAEESARGAADAALDDEFEALFAEAAGLRAPWAEEQGRTRYEVMEGGHLACPPCEEAGSAPSLPSAAGGAAPAGPVAEAEPHPALEAAAGIVAAGAEAEARAPSEASLESRMGGGPAGGLGGEPARARAAGAPDALGGGPCWVRRGGAGRGEGAAGGARAGWRSLGTAARPTRSVRSPWWPGWRRKAWRSRGSRARRRRARGPRRPEAC
ncbi:unnamed protein product [Prorocentrum cordatum]|uniref:Uncharacterized protein n=1 Tax=Prorocentrum cordatum TaxID=2364126 RepID=A0ABN9SNQ6_9DINO|nr:unnamed protein product [Polarella glacialis]